MCQRHLGTRTYVGRYGLQHNKYLALSWGVLREHLRVVGKLMFMWEVSILREDKCILILCKQFSAKRLIFEFGFGLWPWSWASRVGVFGSEPGGGQLLGPRLGITEHCAMSGYQLLRRRGRGPCLGYNWRPGVEGLDDGLLERRIGTGKCGQGDSSQLKQVGGRGKIQRTHISSANKEARRQCHCGEGNRNILALASVISALPSFECWTQTQTIPKGTISFRLTSSSSRSRNLKVVYEATTRHVVEFSRIQRSKRFAGGFVLTAERGFSLETSVDLGFAKNLGQAALMPEQKTGELIGQTARLIWKATSTHNKTKCGRRNYEQQKKGLWSVVRMLQYQPSVLVGDSRRSVQVRGSAEELHRNIQQRPSGFRVMDSAVADQ